MNEQHTPLYPAELLLPAGHVSYASWACVACDQYTSQPEYWERTSEIVGDQPSTLKLMLPECYLAESDQLVPKIHEEMREYLDKGVLQPAFSRGYILCERTTETGTRTGLVGAVDLEKYEFSAGTRSLIRPTEQTIAERLPARLKIRRGAAVEMSHILILVDDASFSVLEPFHQRKESLRKVYDFDLMQHGGHLTGYAIESQEDIHQIESALYQLQTSLGEDPLLMAVGDGNHSLATAKAYWNEIREGLSEEERQTHPARFALCEITNIHDEALHFEPIHRLITGTTPEELYDCWEKYAAERGMALMEEGEGHTFNMVIRHDEYPVVVRNPEGIIPCETMQLFLDEFMEDHPAAKIDYIHGEQNLRTLAQQKDAVGFLLPRIDKRTFFEDVKMLGVLPRKTFSLGEADEKRYYMECKRI